jgi:hypothetical protein
VPTTDHRTAWARAVRCGRPTHTFGISLALAMTRSNRRRETEEDMPSVETGSRVEGERSHQAREGTIERDSSMDSAIYTKGS